MPQVTVPQVTVPLGTTTSEGRCRPRPAPNVPPPITPDSASDGTGLPLRADLPRIVESLGETSLPRRLLIAGVVVSICANLAALIVLSLLRLHQPQSHDALTLLVTLREPEEHVENEDKVEPNLLDELGVEVITDFAADELAVADMTLVLETPEERPTESSAVSDSPSNERQTVDLPAPDEAPKGEQEVTAGADAADDDWTGWNGLDTSGGAGGDGRGGVEYFGIKGEGERIVYIVDASGSMRGDRFKQARDELLYSVENLGPKQKFCVIFFNDHRGTRTFPADQKLVAATDENKQLLREVAATIQPRGYTHPTRFVRDALELTPDVVFFLSDGEIPPNTVRVAGVDNDGSTQIHAIGFKSKEGEDLLQQMADENDGQYRYVE